MVRTIPRMTDHYTVRRDDRAGTVSSQGWFTMAASGPIARTFASPLPRRRGVAAQRRAGASGSRRGRQCLVDHRGKGARMPSRSSSCIMLQWSPRRSPTGKAGQQRAGDEQEAIASMEPSSITEGKHDLGESVIAKSLASMGPSSI